MMLFFIILIIVSLFALIILNRFYELEPWFKRVLMGVLLAGIIGAVVSFFLKTKDTSLDKSNIEQISSTEDEGVVLEEPEPIAENDQYLKQAEILEQRIVRILDQIIPEKRTGIKNTRMKRYNRDSLFITIETAEQLLKSRQRFLSNDRIAYIEGNKSPSDFSSAIDRYKTDLDSFIENFNLNP